MNAICSGMGCHYEYTEGDATITGFTIDHSTNKLTISGSGFTTPTKIEMGYLACENIVTSAD